MVCIFTGMGHMNAVWGLTTVYIGVKICVTPVLFEWCVFGIVWCVCGECLVCCM